MKDFTDLDTPSNEFFARSLNIGDDQVEALAEPGAAVVIFVPNCTSNLTLAG